MNRLYLFLVEVECTQLEDCAKNQICNAEKSKCECKDTDHVVDTDGVGCKPKGRKNVIQSSIKCLGHFYFFWTANNFWTKIP